MVWAYAWLVYHVRALSAIANPQPTRCYHLSLLHTFPSLQPPFLHIITPINYSLGMKLRKLRENCVWTFSWTPVGICKQPEEHRHGTIAPQSTDEPYFFFGPCFVPSPHRHRDSWVELLCLHYFCMPISI